MVRIDDIGSEFDAPLEVVWRFLGTPEVHAPAHSGSRNRKVTPVRDATIELSMEQILNGTWNWVRNRVTMLPPLAMVIEALEGPLAGSKSVYVYTPSGPRTRIDVYGEFVSPQLSEEQIGPVVRAFLDRVFAEDNSAIQEFAAGAG